jgi:hypothetical protein
VFRFQDRGVSRGLVSASSRATSRPSISASFTGPVLSKNQPCTVQSWRSNGANGCSHDHVHLPQRHCTAVSHLVATFTLSDQRQWGHAGVGSRRSLLRSRFETSRAGDSGSSAGCTTGSGVSGSNVIVLKFARGQSLYVRVSYGRGARQRSVVPVQPRLRESVLGEHVPYPGDFAAHRRQHWRCIRLAWTITSLR